MIRRMGDRSSIPGYYLTQELDFVFVPEWPANGMMKISLPSAYHGRKNLYWFLFDSRSLLIFAGFEWKHAWVSGWTLSGERWDKARVGKVYLFSMYVRMVWELIAIPTYHMKHPSPPPNRTHRTVPQLRVNDTTFWWYKMIWCKLLQGYEVDQQVAFDADELCKKVSM